MTAKHTKQDPHCFFTWIEFLSIQTEIVNVVICRLATEMTDVRLSGASVTVNFIT